MLIIDFERHLHANFRKLFEGKNFKDAVYVAARVSTQFEFKLRMKVLANLDQKVADWLLRQELSL